jgi:hypothetical protein
MQLFPTEYVHSMQQASPIAVLSILNKSYGETDRQTSSTRFYLILPFVRFHGMIMDHLFHWKRSVIDRRRLHADVHTRTKRSWQASPVVSNRFDVKTGASRLGIWNVLLRKPLEPFVSHDLLLCDDLRSYCWYRIARECDLMALMRANGFLSHH